MNKELAKKIISVNNGEGEADLEIRNAKVVNVYTHSIDEENVYILDGIIIGLGEKRKAKESIDAKGKYLVPGLIDSHCHIESSHLSPSSFSDAVVPCGTTTVIADSHEICNVSGTKAMDYMLSSADKATLSIFFMFPSCVPATFSEHSGAILNSEDISPYYSNDKILGLGEMMNYPGLLSSSDIVLDKLSLSWESGKKIDGHAPRLSGKELDSYISLSIDTDHEAETVEELKEKISKGMYILLREGTVCRNVKALIKGVDEYNYRRCLFCTDDRQPESIKESGHINNAINVALEEGFDPILALTMATLNAAECYNLKDRGAIALGKRADFFLCSSLDKITPESVYILGKKVAENGKVLTPSPHVDINGVEGKVYIKNLDKDTFSLKLKSNRVRTIDVIPGGVVTLSGEDVVDTDKDGEWIYNKDKDILKISVLERHHRTGFHANALIRGFGLKSGAIALTIAHDSHNVIVVGTNDDDMLIAVKELVTLGGGIALCKNGKILGSHALEIAGLMTDRSVDEVSSELRKLHKIVDGEMGGVNEGLDPFMTLCFMALPVIPELKITDSGLFDVSSFSFVDVSIV